MQRLAFTLVGLALLGLPARAEGLRERSLSLTAARTIAEGLGPDVLLARRREAIARAQVDAVGALANPSLLFQTSRLSARFVAGIGVPVPLFGQRATAIEAARADADVAGFDAIAWRLEARWNATRAWLDLWEAQERARLAQITATEADRLASVANERFAAGSAPRLDAVRTAADRARARAEAQASQAGVAAASARLATWLGLPELAALRAAGTPDLGALPPEEVAAQRLVAQHPALVRDRAQIEAAAAHVRAEQRLRWPVVNAQLAISELDPTTPGTDVIGGLSFEPPLLSQRRGAIARARAEQGLAEATVDLELRRLHAQLTDAYRQAEGAGLRARALATEVLPALEEARRMTEEGYRDGRLDLLRVLEAQRALLDGRVAYVESRATWQRALADVERSLGAPLEPGGARAP